MDQQLGDGLLSHPLITNIASKYNKSTAQILLRWNTLRGVSVICKSSKISRIEENFHIFDFFLSTDEVRNV